MTGFAEKRHKSYTKRNILFNHGYTDTSLLSVVIRPPVVMQSSLTPAKKKKKKTIFSKNNRPRRKVIRPQAPVNIKAFCGKLDYGRVFHKKRLVYGQKARCSLRTLPPAHANGVRGTGPAAAILSAKVARGRTESDKPELRKGFQGKPWVFPLSCRIRLQKSHRTTICDFCSL